MVMSKVVVVLLFSYLHQSQGGILQRQNEFATSYGDTEGFLKKMKYVQGSNVNIHQRKVARSFPLGKILYYFDNGTYDNLIYERVRTAMNTIEGSACVEFVAPSLMIQEQSSWINITNPERKRECQHKPIFKKSGEIVLELGYDCLKQHEILHSLLHAIGLNDEVTHPHRDRYVKVVWNKIRPAYHQLYYTLHDSKPLSEYDPFSIMQFDDRAFTIDGQATLLPLMSGLIIKPSEDLSLLDKMKLRLLYDHECNKRNVAKILQSCVNKFRTESNKLSSNDTELNDQKSSIENNDSNVYQDNNEKPEGDDKVTAENTNDKDNDKSNERPDEAEKVTAENDVDDDKGDHKSNEKPEQDDKDTADNVKDVNKGNENPDDDDKATADSDAYTNENGYNKNIVDSKEEEKATGENTLTNNDKGKAENKSISNEEVKGNENIKSKKKPIQLKTETEDFQLKSKKISSEYQKLANARELSMFNYRPMKK